MSSQKHITTTWIIILSVLPCILGLGTIMHYCNACSDSPKEELLSPVNENLTLACICPTTECSLRASESNDPYSNKKQCQSELAKIKPVLHHVQTEELLPLLTEIHLLSYCKIIPSLQQEDTHKPLFYSDYSPLSNFLTSQGALRQSIFGTFIL